MRNSSYSDLFSSQCERLCTWFLCDGSHRWRHVRRHYST